MPIRWMILRTALVIPLGLACSRRSNTDLGGTDSAVVNIVATGAGFDVSLIRERKTLATWHETTLDGHLGKRVADTLDKHPTLGVLFCGSSTVSLQAPCRELRSSTYEGRRVLLPRPQELSQLVSVSRRRGREPL